MQSRDEYLNTVCEQIRFRAARKTIRSEIEAHIDDRIAEGKSETEAIAAMGDAIQTGKALSRIHRPRLEWRVILCMLLLSAVSTVLSFSMTEYGSYIFPSGVFGEMVRPMLYGLILMAGMYLLKYSLLERLKYVFYGAGLLYAGLYILTFEPFNNNILLTQTPVIVISTLFLILGFIGIISQSTKRTVPDFIILTVLSIAAIVVIYVISSVSALILAAMLITVFTVSRWKQKAHNWPLMSVYTGIIAASLVLCYFLIIRGYYGFNTDAFSDNNGEAQYLLGKSYFIGQSKYCGWTLENSRSSFVITAIIGMYGWLPGLLAAAVCGTMGVLMVLKASRIAHTYGRLLAVGISVYFLVRFMLHFLANMGVIGGYFSLPFLSFGRFEFLSDAVLLGAFLSVWRRSTYMKDEAKEMGLIKRSAEA